MGQVLRNGYVIGGTLLALPLAALVVWGLLRWRLARGLPRAVALGRSIAEVGAVVGTVPWLVMTMRPGPFGDRRVDLIPVHDLLTMHPASVLVQIIGNLMVFAAAGFFLPRRFPALASITRIVLLAAAASTVIEVLQWALDLGRVSAVSDVLLNAAGAGLAAALSRRRSGSWSWGSGATRSRVSLGHHRSGCLSWNRSPVGPLSGSVASQTNVSAAASGD